MRAYLIVDEMGAPGLACADAWVVGRTSALRGMPGRTVPVLVRVDDTDAAGLDPLAGFAPDAIVLPACEGRDVARLGAHLAVYEAQHGLPDGGIGVVALLTTPVGALAAASFVGASPRLRGIGWDAALADALGAPALAADHGWNPILSQARALVRLAAAAAGVAAIEAAYPGTDAGGLERLIAAARRDGFAAMFARDSRQARAIRDGA